MALELELDESVRHAVRRIGRKRARKAFKALADGKSMEGVHSARKQIKQMRAMLRLTRRGARRRQFRKLTRCLKRVACSLSGPRDAFVKTAAFQSLKEHFSNDTSDDSFMHIEPILRNERDRAERHAARDIRKTARVFKRICHDFERIDLKGGGWRILGPGLKEAYRGGREAYRLALKTECADALHEWRKRSKDLYYHVEFLCGIWPEQMHAMHEDLEKLADALGDGHDLTLLTASDCLADLRGEAQREVDLLVKLAERRGKELQMRAFALGDRLYAEKPNVFCGRLHGYWTRWRRSQKARI